MKHLLSIIIFFSFVPVASGLNIPIDNKKECVAEGFNWHSDNVCRTGLDLGDAVPLGEPFIPQEIEKNVIEDIQEVWSERTPTQKENLNILIVVVIFLGVIIFLLINASVKKTKAIYESSSIPLKNKVKRKNF